MKPPGRKPPRRAATIKTVADGVRVGLILLLAGVIAPASANNTWFVRVWKTDDGLINNNIVSTVQSSDGYLWVAPSVGLMRFDGIQFSRFPLKDFTGPTDNHISTMLCDRTGVLWIATYGGQVIGIKPDLSVIKIPSSTLPKDTPLTLAQDKSGSIWLGYLNAIVRIKNGHVKWFTTKEGVPSGNFYSLISDGAGNIWLCKGNQICLFKNGQFQRVTDSRGTSCLAATHTNAIWFISSNQLWTCNAEGMAQDRGTFPDLAARRRAMLEDHTGAVWIGTDRNGLIRYDKSGFHRIDTSYPFILSLTEDQEGNLWVGTAGGGLERVSLSGVSLERVSASERIESICENTNGVLWGATHEGMLVTHVNGQWIPALTHAPFSEMVTAVAADSNGTVWIGTRDGKLYQLDNTNPITWRQTRVHGAIYALLPMVSGDLWILGSDTLQCLHDGQLQDVHLPRPVGKISAIAKDADGNVWIGGKGIVMRFNGKKFVDETPHLPMISNLYVCCLYGTSDGSMWISCGGLGLLRYKNGQVSQIGTAQGLFNDYIAQIVEDSHGWFWFCSDHGVFKIRLQELDQAAADHSFHLRPIVYGRNEGLSSLEALFSTSSPTPSLPLALHSRDGRVWLLTQTGVVVADPMLLPENSIPPVLLTQISMDGQTIASYGNVTSTHTAANLKTLKLPLRLPPSYHHLEFDFTALNFSAPENIHFRYKLRGFDPNWIEAGARRSADYSRLAAGHYQFQVAACNGDGPWSKLPATLAFTVTPFIWQTWWFRLGALSLFTLVVIALVRYVFFRRMQRRLHAAEHQTAIERERGRIARDLHDDLGGGLNLAALTLDMTQRELDDKEALNGKIQHCSTLVRRAAQTVDEIVWAINPRNDTLHYLVDYISQFAVEFLQAADILCLVELPDNVPNQRISPEVRHNLWLVSKEALNNIVRHAQASEVCLRVAASENQLAISIKDNGQGFERPPENASGNGLNNMRHRMEEIGGQFHLESRPGTGTHIVLLYSRPFPIQPG